MSYSLWLCPPAGSACAREAAAAIGALSRRLGGARCPTFAPHVTLLGEAWRPAAAPRASGRAAALADAFPRLATLVCAPSSLARPLPVARLQAAFRPSPMMPLSARRARCARGSARPMAPPSGGSGCECRAHAYRRVHMRARAA